MPVLTSAGSDMDTSDLSGHLHAHRALVSKIFIIIVATAVLTAVSISVQQVVSRWFAKRYLQHKIGRRPGTVTSASGFPPDLKPLTDSSWAPPGEGPSHSETQASWDVSRGEGSGTDPVGLGGSVEGSSPGRMDGEKSTTPTGDRSRGVSIHLSSEAAQDPSSLPSSCQVIPAAADDEEEGDDVRTQQPTSHTPALGPTGGASAGSTGEERDSMDDDYFGREKSGPGPAMAASNSMIPILSQPEDSAGVAAAAAAVPDIGRGPTWRRRFELNFSSSSPSSPSPSASPILAEHAVHLAHRAAFDIRRLPPTYVQSFPAGTDIVRSGTTGMADGVSLHSDQATSGMGLGTDSSTCIGPAPRSVQKQTIHARSPAVPPTSPLDIRRPQYASEQIIDASRATHLSPGHTLTSYSYPSISPLLPPPPSTMDHHFDLGQIMFPGGGAIDGGVRVVHDSHEHSHDESGPTDVRGDSGNGLDDPSTGWKRHTRVYGGGVCLACAAAGGGGFYGARVRPEDKR